MTRLWLVRHGPTHAKTMIGWTDMAADLSDSAALARLDAYLPTNAVVVSSDLIRAVNTADRIVNTRARLPHDRRLREIHFGAWEDRSFAEVESESPDLIRAFWDQPGSVAAPKGESWNDLRSRVWAALNLLTSAHPTQDIVVVAHFGAILAAIELAANISTTEAFSHTIDNLSVTQIHHDRSRWQIGEINKRP